MEEVKTVWVLWSRYRIPGLEGDTLRFCAVFASKEAAFKNVEIRASREWASTISDKHLDGTYVFTIHPGAEWLEVRPEEVIV